MGKRLGETDKWNDQWFRTRLPLAKLWYLYLLDRCDQGGVWEIDLPGADKDMGLSESKMKVDQQFWKGLVKNLNKEPETMSLLDSTEEKPVPRLIVLPSNHIWITRFVVFHHSFEPNMKNRYFMAAIAAMKKHGIWEKWKKLWGHKLNIQNEDYEPGPEQPTEKPGSVTELIDYCRNAYPGFPESQVRKFWDSKENDGWGTRWRKSLNHWVNNFHGSAGKKSILDMKSQIRAIDEEIKRLQKDTYTPPGKSIPITKPENLDKIAQLKKNKEELNRKIAEGDV